MKPDPNGPSNASRPDTHRQSGASRIDDLEFVAVPLRD
jgi:hypothetical protein